MASEPRRARLPAAIALLAALLVSLPAQAQQPSAADKETARSLMDRGDERLAARDYAAAVQAYAAADTLMHLPMTGVAVARAQAGAGLLLEARDKAIQVTQLPLQADETSYHARARAEAAALANQLATRIPSIQVALDGAPAGAVIMVDGVALPPGTGTEPRKVNPGAHVVSSSAPGFATSRVEVVVSEGALLRVPIALQAQPGTGQQAAGPLAGEQPPLGPLAPKPAGGVSPLAIVGFSVGGASLVAAAITGGLSLSQTAKLKQSCTPQGDCGTDHDHDLATANTLANVANATVAIGVAGVGLGVVSLILSRPHEAPAAPAARVEPVVGPRGIGLRGTF